MSGRASARRRALGMDRAASSKTTRERLDWNPTHVGLIEDLERGTYFDATSE